MRSPLHAITLPNGERSGPITTSTQNNEPYLKTDLISSDVDDHTCSVPADILEYKSKSAEVPQKVPAENQRYSQSAEACYVRPLVPFLTQLHAQPSLRSMAPNRTSEKQIGGLISQSSFTEQPEVTPAGSHVKTPDYPLRNTRSNQWLNGHNSITRIPSAAHRLNLQRPNQNDETGILLSSPALNEKQQRSGSQNQKFRRRSQSCTAPPVQVNRWKQRQTTARFSKAGEQKRPSFEVSTDLPLRPRSGGNATYCSDYERQYNTAIVRSQSKFDDAVEAVIHYRHISLDPKQFGKEQVRRDAAKVILRYLQTKNFPQCPKLKDLLNPPTASLYPSLMTFLMYQTDPKRRDDRLLEEKVPQFFKDWGYPLTIAKSHMKSPTTPVTWPQHLAAMAWLCSLLMCEENYLTEQPFKQPIDVDLTLVARTPRIIGSQGWLDDFKPSSSMRSGLPDSSLKTFDSDISRRMEEPESPARATLRVIREAYQFYHHSMSQAAETGTSPAVDRVGIRKIFDVAIIKWEQRINAEEEILRVEAEQAFEEFQKTEEEIKYPEKLKQRLVVLEEEEQKFWHRTSMLDSNISQKERQIRKIQTDCLIKEREIDELAKELKELNDKIDKQGISKEDVVRYRKELEMQKQRYEASKDQKEEIQKQNWRIKEKIEALRDEVLSKTHKISQSLADANARVTRGGSQSARRRGLPPPLKLTLENLTHNRLEELVKQQYERTSINSYQSAAESDIDEASREENRKDNCETRIGSEGNQFDRAFEKLLEDAMGAVDWKAWKARCRSDIDAEKKDKDNTGRLMVVLEQKSKKLNDNIKIKLQTNQKLQDDFERLSFDLQKERSNKYDAEMDHKREIQKLEVKEEGVSRGLLNKYERLQARVEELEEESGQQQTDNKRLLVEIGRKAEEFLNQFSKKLQLSIAAMQELDVQLMEKNDELNSQFQAMEDFPEDDLLLKLEGCNNLSSAMLYSNSGNEGLNQQLPKLLHSQRFQHNYENIDKIERDEKLTSTTLLKEMQQSCNEFLDKKNSTDLSTAVDAVTNPMRFNDDEFMCIGK